MNKHELLDELKSEFIEIKPALGLEGNAAAKRIIKQVLEDVKEDELDRALELLRKAKKFVLLEETITSEINQLKPEIRIIGKSVGLIEEITDIVKSDDIEKAENMMHKLRTIVKDENRVFDKIREAEKLISEKLAGADLDEADKFRKDGYIELKSGNFEKAEELADKSKLAAKPNTDHLLQKAKDIAEKAQSSFSSKNFEKSIELWKNSQKEYSRARDVAKQRNEDDILQRLDKVEEIVRGNIFNAETAIDNREMLTFVELGNNKVKEANNLFKDKKFIEAKEVYKESEKTFNQALEYAVKRDFIEDKNKINEKLKSICSNIDASLLSHGDAMLNKAEEKINDEHFAEAEKGFLSALEYLASLDVKQKDDTEELIVRGRKGLIDSEMEQGKEKMRDAEELFKANHFDEAKEAFRNVLGYLGEIVDKTSEFKFEQKLKEINGLIQACTDNISIAAENLTQVGVIQHEFVGVDDIEGGIANFKNKKIGENKNKSNQIIILREPEFFNGFIRLKISIQNNMQYTATDVFLDLDYDDNILRLDHHEPDTYATKKGKIQLGNILPNSDKTIALYFDPLICSKKGTVVNCRIDYKDASGILHFVMMKPSKNPIVCPIFKTEQDINIGRLKELVTSLPAKSSKRFSMPSGVNVNKALTLCHEVIQMHDVRYVRTFKTTDDKTYEIWYYGKTKVKRIDLVIKASVSEETEIIEFFVAAPDQEVLTGLLPELGRNFSKKGNALGKLAPVFNVSIKNSQIVHSNLLDACDIDGICSGNVVIEDSFVQRSNIGNNADTQIKNSFVQHSNIGTGARKCPNCDRDVEANEKYCHECGTKL